MYMEEVISFFEFDFYEFTKTCLLLFALRVLKGISWELILSLTSHFHGVFNKQKAARNFQKRRCHAAV